MEQSGKPENRPDTGRPKGTFPKGVSGNPGGRPKRTPEEFALIQACKLKAPYALHVIESLMYHAGKDSVRLAAAVYILDRAYGKTSSEPPPISSLLDHYSTPTLITVLNLLEEKYRQKSAAVPF